MLGGGDLHVTELTNVVIVLLVSNKGSLLLLTKTYRATRVL